MLEPKTQFIPKVKTVEIEEHRLDHIIAQKKRLENKIKRLKQLNHAHHVKNEKLQEENNELQFSLQGYDVWKAVEAMENSEFLDRFKDMEAKLDQVLSTLNPPPTDFQLEREKVLALSQKEFGDYASSFTKPWIPPRMGDAAALQTMIQTSFGANYDPASNHFQQRTQNGHGPQVSNKVIRASEK